MKIERYISEYANAKIRDIKNNDLMDQTKKEESLERILSVLQYRKRGIITSDEAVKMILEERLGKISESYNISDYTIEWCPYCETEQVIFAEGVTACGSCGTPLAPCSVCEDCVSDCPYGCDGTDKDMEKKITRRNIMPEEFSFVMSYR